MLGQQFDREIAMTLFDRVDIDTKSQIKKKQFCDSYVKLENNLRYDFFQKSTSYGESRDKAVDLKYKLIDA